MPKSEEENRRIREAQRENILNAAKAAILRNGMSATMADIAVEAKISQGLAYRYFDSKEAIFAALFEQMVDNMINLKEDAEENSSPSNRLRKLISRMLSGSEVLGNFEIAVKASYEKSSIHCFAEMMRSGEINGQKLIEVMKNRLIALSDLVEEIIAKGQRSGEFVDDDPKKLTIMLLSAIKGLTHLAIHQPEMFRSSYPYTEAVMRLVLNANLSTSETRKAEPC